MEVRFTRAARKHRIGKAHALAAMESAGEPIVVPARDNEIDDRLVYLGTDDRGIDLEVIAVQTPDYLLVIHVMPGHYRRRSHE